jgi:hypothetical protein
MSWNSSLADKWQRLLTDCEYRLPRSLLRRVDSFSCAYASHWYTAKICLRLQQTWLDSKPFLQAEAFAVQHGIWKS